MQIRTATGTDNEITAIQRVAYATWPATFGAILAPAQIAYMLEWMYSATALRQQIDAGHVFLLALHEEHHEERHEERVVGYASYEMHYTGTPRTKIHKIYVLPEAHGCGTGRALIDVIRQRAVTARQEALTLNVNRHNRAIGFYERYGFSTIATEDIEIGNGYYMNDVVMELRLSPPNPEARF